MSFNGPPKLSIESSEGRVEQEYLHDLGLSIEDFRGKRVLDVAAGKGEFVRFLNSHGSEATGLDVGNLIKPEDESTIREMGSQFVIGRAEKMPFPDDSFDFVVSHAAIPNIANHKFGGEGDRKHWEERIKEDQQRRIDALKEMLRVITSEGEIRCGPVVSSEEYKYQSKQVEEAIATIGLEAIVTREPLTESSFRLILKKKV